MEGQINDSIFLHQYFQALPVELNNHIGTFISNGEDIEASPDEYLKFIRIHLGNDGFVSLIDSLEDTNVKYLFLEGNGITGDDIDKIISGNSLSKCGIRRISLPDNRIDEERVK